MATPTRFFHDRLVLLLLSVNSFFVILTAVLILLRLGGGKTSGYIVQYRSNLGLNRFATGDALDLIAFAIFGFVIFGLNLLISYKIYPARRAMAITTLSLCLVLLVISAIVSNALLVLR